MVVWVEENQREKAVDLLKSVRGVGRAVSSEGAEGEGLEQLEEAGEGGGE